MQASCLWQPSLIKSNPLVICLLCSSPQRGLVSHHSWYSSFLSWLTDSQWWCVQWAGTKMSAIIVITHIISFHKQFPIVMKKVIKTKYGTHPECAQTARLQNVQVKTELVFLYYRGPSAAIIWFFVRI